MQRMGPRPILCINQSIVEIDANIDADTHADVMSKQGFRLTLMEVIVLPIHHWRF